MSAAQSLESYVAGNWSRGPGVESVLIDPTSGAILATVSAKGLDLAGALKFARQQGSPALQALDYAARAKLLGAIADVLAANRAHYEEIAILNSGNTKIDASIDIDGGIGTLKYYARLGAPLGEAKTLTDGKAVRLTKAENYQAIHLLTPRRGVAVHINAFNFPSWGLWEKAACSLLAGMPVLAKPASATCLLSHAMVRDVVSANILPAGALSLLCGGVGDLLDRVTGDDVIAFTGSSDTGNHIRGHRNVLARGTKVNVEADSLNAALLAPSIAPGAPLFDSFVKEVAREMTVKAGQKCTAVRRILVPAERVGAVADALSARLAKTTVGDPRNETTRMGPLVNREQQARVLRDIAALTKDATIVCGSIEVPNLEGIDGAKAAFVAPTVLKIADASKVQTVNEIEVFGPAATIIPYRKDAEAFALVARGGGSLVTSVFGDDIDFLSRAVSELCACNGRVLVVDPSVAEGHSGHGIVMPQCNHGGPGRAGNGEELGGLNGLRLYHQRVALQGSTDLIAAAAAKAVTFE